MAGTFNSDDASEIFWPGYVDAVTNLAINLLFVIAVMATVVLSSIVQISRMKPAGNTVDEIPKTKSLASQNPVQVIQQAQKALTQARQSPQTTPAQMRQTMQQAELALAQSLQNQKSLSDNVDQLQRKLQQLDKQAQAEQVKNAISQGRATQSAPQTQADSDRAGGITTDVGQKSQVVQARQKPRAAQQGKNELQELSAGGVVVVFALDVIELSEAETTDLLSKISMGGAIRGGRWQLRVVSPKGFSEATRLAYYRLNTLRNILITNGASPQDIEMRVIEAEDASANNARVLVRLMP